MRKLDIGIELVDGRRKIVKVELDRKTRVARAGHLEKTGEIVNSGVNGNDYLTLVIALVKFLIRVEIYRAGFGNGYRTGHGSRYTLDRFLYLRSRGIVSRYFLFRSLNLFKRGNNLGSPLIIRFSWYNYLGMLSLNLRQSFTHLTYL